MLKNLPKGRGLIPFRSIMLNHKPSLSLPLLTDTQEIISHKRHGSAHQSPIVSSLFPLTLGGHAFLPFLPLLPDIFTAPSLFTSKSTASPRVIVPRMEFLYFTLSKHQLSPLCPLTELEQMKPDYSDTELHLPDTSVCCM